MYVKGSSKKDKDDWKENKGIKRNKSQAQSDKESKLALEINKLKGDGSSTRKIAQQLSIGVSTVQRYLSK